MYRNCILVIIGAINKIINPVEINIMDTLMSIGIAIFILFNVLKSFKSIGNGTIFLEKVPDDIGINKLKGEIKKIENV